LAMNLNKPQPDIAP